MTDLDNNLHGTGQRETFFRVILKQMQGLRSKENY